MNYIFTFVENNAFNLRSVMQINRANVNFTPYGTKDIGNLGTKIWNRITVLTKNLKTFKYI